MKENSKSLNFKVGDLVTGYPKGYFRITRIERRWENKTLNSAFERQVYCLTEYNPDTCGEEMNPVYHAKKVYNLDGKLSKDKKEYSFDAGYAKLASEHIKSRISDLYKEIIRLKHIESYEKQS